MRQLVILAICAISTGSQASADILFSFDYADVNTGSGFGFDDAIEGATRRATVQAVGDYINTVVDHNGAVDITWNASTNAPGSGTLASMGPFFFNNVGISNGFVFDHATTGIDPNALNPDGLGQVNFGRNWNSDLSAPVAGEFDLFTVVLHEMTHSLGFVSLFDPNTGDTQITGTRSVFDTLLEDGSGNRLLSGETFVGNTSVFTSGDLQIDTGASTFGIFSPGTFQPGSSLGHLDFDAPGNNVMFPSIATGVAKREYAEGDLAVLSAIGWNLKTETVPEPSTSIAMSLGMIGFWVIRRRSIAERS